MTAVAATTGATPPQGAGGGRFVTLEGGEGSGKSTHVRRLAARLEACGQTVVVTREPGGTPGAEAIRGLLVSGATGLWSAQTEALLMTAARRDHLERTIWPALAAGTWVLCDRFFDSTLAYQGYGHGLPREWLQGLYNLAIGDFRPDTTLILDLPPTEGIMRAGHRTGSLVTVEDRFERMGLAFHERVCVGFRELAAAEPERCVVVDTRAPMAEVTDTLWRVLCTRYAELQGRDGMVAAADTP